MAGLMIGPLLRHVGPNDATIWVETDAPCARRGPGRRGHGLGDDVPRRRPSLRASSSSTASTPGSSTPYEVPARRRRGMADRRTRRSRRAGSGRSTRPGRIRLLFGSCREPGRPDEPGGRHRAVDPDVLEAFAARMTEQEHEHAGPTLLLLVGDQVYADDTSPAMQAFIATRRDIRTARRAPRSPTSRSTPGSTTSRGASPTIRWLLSTLPSSMIFDDHDVRDDWNTSARVAARHAGDRLVGGADHRRADVVLDLPASRQPVAGGPGGRRRSTRPSATLPDGEAALRAFAPGGRPRGGRRQGHDVVVSARLRAACGCSSSIRAAGGSSPTAAGR